MSSTLEARLVLDARASLGECPLWHPHEQVLYWVDIAGKTINRFDPVTQKNQAWPTPTEPGCIALRQLGGLVAACRDGFYGFDASRGVTDKIAYAPYDTINMRFNDGKVDAQGRFWAGAMFEPRTDTRASMYVLERGRVREGWGPAQGFGVKVSNGLCFDTVRERVYQSDTPNHTSYHFDWDAAAGAVLSRKVFFTRDDKKAAPDYGGRPDGAALDRDGNYWSAQYEGGCVICIDPDGKLKHIILVPAKRTTMVAFGGPDYRTLYITTARDGATADELTAQPYAGGIFAVTLGLGDTGGVPEPFYLD
jgi:sugar lactone lactonase YvrE